MESACKTPVQLFTAIIQLATATFLTGPVMLLISLSVGLASLQPCAATPFEWEYTGSLKTARFHHTATLLPDGRVLAVGGERGHNPLATAELYDPGTGTWSGTGSLSTARDSHTATLLPNGTVLVAGGNPDELDSAELYDPATGTWSLTGSLNSMRKDHAATLLPNGMVLVTGGALAHKAALASAELYAPGIVAATRVDGHGTIDKQGDRVTFHLRAGPSDDRASADFFLFAIPLPVFV
jgi:large repetitive protein